MGREVTEFRYIENEIANLLELDEVNKPRENFFLSKAH